MMVSTTFFDEAKTLQAVVGEPRAAGRYATASAAMVRAPVEAINSMLVNFHKRPDELDPYRASWWMACGVKAASGAKAAQIDTAR